MISRQVWRECIIVLRVFPLRYLFPALGPHAAREHLEKIVAQHAVQDGLAQIVPVLRVVASRHRALPFNLALLADQLLLSLV